MKDANDIIEDDEFEKCLANSSHLELRLMKYYQLPKAYTKAIVTQIG